MGLEQERARDSASGGRGRDREQGAATGARAGPGGRPHAGQRGQPDAREIQGTIRACQSPGATVPGTVEHGCWRPGTRARRPTDLLTDRRRHAPLYPAPPRPAPPPRLAPCLYLLYFFSASASFGLPWRQSLLLAQAGAWTVSRALVESGGKFPCSRKRAPSLGDRCRGSFLPVDRGMRRASLLASLSPSL